MNDETQTYQNEGFIPEERPPRDTFGDAASCYRLLFETNPHPMYILELESLRFLDVNGAALQLYGYTRDAFLKLHATDIRPEDEHGRFLESVRQPGPKPQGEAWTHHDRHGRRIAVRIWVTQLQYQGREALITTVIDETEKLEVVKRLTEASLTMEAILNQSPVAILSTNDAGVVQTWNPAAAAIFALPGESAIGTEFRRLSLGRSPVLSQIQSDLASGQPIESQRVRTRRQDGQAIELSVSARPLLDATGSVRGSVVVVADVTAKNQAERELRNLNASLERRVIERTAELEAANQELEAFCFSIAHDLRQPLRAIDGFSRAVSEDYGPRLGATGRDQLLRVRRAAQRLGEIMDALLALSRVTRAHLEREWVNLGDIARSVAAELAANDPSRSVEIHIDSMMRAYGDPRLLRLLVENLLENAWKFTSRTEAARIEFTTDLIDGHTIYQVKDNGAGFDMRYVDKLFLAFERLHTMQEFPGNGIGLATCHRIVTRHGGQISLVGSIGHGATALFTLQPGP